MKLQYFPYVKTAVLPLVAVTLPFAIIEQFIYFEAKNMQDKILLGGFGLILALIEGFFVLLVLGRTVHALSGNSSELGPYFKKHLKDLAIESLRAMGRVAVGLLLFIVPGILRATRYYLVPFIVLFDSKYQNGEIDVLKQATRLLEGRLLLFFVVLCLTQIFMFGIQLGAINFSMFVAPLEWFLIYFLEIILQAIMFLFFYKYYKRLTVLQTEVQ